MSPHRLLVLGASSAPICGVRAHASLLNAALESLPCTSTRSVWWERSTSAPAAALGSLWDYLGHVREAAATFGPDRVILHYSVLAWADAGQPWAVPPMVARLRSIGVPITAFLHEYMVPVRWRQPRSVAFAGTHLPALLVLLRASDSVVVTTEQRLQHLRVRRWLRHRPVTFIPVFSTVGPVARPAAMPPSIDLVLGVFGFGTPTYPAHAVVSAVAMLRRMGLPVRLRLVGAPGPSSAAGKAWSAAATTAGIGDAIEFTGVLSEARLAECIAGLDVMILPDPGGPASRKTTLAAGLAHGLAIVAVDGPERWDELRASGAIVLSTCTAEGMAGAVAPLMDDARLRSEQGRRARCFYEARMAPEVSARSLMDFLRSARGGESSRTS